MKILLIADASSVHTIKWANALYKKGIQIYIFSLSDYEKSEYTEGINIILSTRFEHTKINDDGSWIKIGYLSALPLLKNTIKSVQPDIIHSYYASSYGLLGALCNYQPFFVSVWGNDVFDFPKKSFIHKLTFKYILKKAQKIFSTSNVMAEEIKLYTHKPIDIIPFGVDSSVFFKFKVDPIFSETDFVVGTIKSFEINYGVEYLIRAFATVISNNPQKSLRLLLVGDGSLMNSLKDLVKHLNIDSNVKFIGKVPNSKTPIFYNMMDIVVFPSIKESFGVAVVEALAAERVVVASKVGGISEIITNGINGILVHPQNIKELIDAIDKLISDKSLSQRLSKTGRERVLNSFDWNKNVDQQIEFYYKLIN